MVVALLSLVPNCCFRCGRNVLHYRLAAGVARLFFYIQSIISNWNAVFSAAVIGSYTPEYLLNIVHSIADIFSCEVLKFYYYLQNRSFLSFWTDSKEIDHNDVHFENITSSLTRKQAEAVRKRIDTLNESTKRKLGMHIPPSKHTAYPADVRTIFPTKTNGQPTNAEHSSATRRPLQRKSYSEGVHGPRVWPLENETCRLDDQLGYRYSKSSDMISSLSKGRQGYGVYLSAENGLDRRGSDDIRLGTGSKINCYASCHWRMVTKLQVFFFRVLFLRAVFKWLSKVITWLRLLRLMIGLKDSRQFFNQWEAKPKPIAPCTRDFSRASSELQVIARNCDWFIALFAPVVIGRSNCFGFGFSTVIWKPRYNDDLLACLRCSARP